MLHIPALHALLWFGALTLLLMFLHVNWRLFKIATGTPADSWTRGKPNDDPAVVQRLGHAHLNCLENLPILAILVLTATLIGKSDIAEPWAGYVLLARIGQVIVHMIGVSHILVLVRATFFTAQVVFFAIMFWRLLA